MQQFFLSNLKKRLEIRELKEICNLAIGNWLKIKISSESVENIKWTFKNA